MGVQGLWDVLHANHCKRTVPLASLRSEVWAVDLTLWLVELSRLKLTGVEKPQCRIIAQRVLGLARFGISVVAVVDGTPPPEKQQARASRCDPLVAKMLEAMGVPIVRAPGEGEATCAALQRSGAVDACTTRDGDAFLFGATRVVRSFSLSASSPAQAEVYTLEDIQAKTRLGREKLVAFGLLVGCDYKPGGVDGVGVSHAVEFLDAHTDAGVLPALSAWSAPLAPGAAVVVPPRQPHCSACGHVGNKRSHVASGCSVCGTGCGCTPGGPCPCAHHVALRARAAVEGSTRVEQQLKRLGFPNVARCVSLFLEPRACSVASVVGRQPATHTLLCLWKDNGVFAEQTCGAHALDLYMAWWRMHGKGDGPAVARVKRVFKRQFQQYAELEWDVTQQDLLDGLCPPVLALVEGPSPVTTVEPLGTAEVAFRAAFAVFNAAKAKAKRPKGKRRRDAGQTSILDAFAVKRKPSAVSLVSSVPPRPAPNAHLDPDRYKLSTPSPVSLVPPRPAPNAHLDPDRFKLSTPSPVSSVGSPPLSPVPSPPPPQWPPTPRKRARREDVVDLMTPDSVVDLTSPP